MGKQKDTSEVNLTLLAMACYEIILKKEREKAEVKTKAEKGE